MEASATIECTVGRVPDNANLQLVLTTHSPLVMASAEAWFDPERDAWLDLDLEGAPRESPCASAATCPAAVPVRGSPAKPFDLATDRGRVEPESAIVRARELLRKSQPQVGRGHGGARRAARQRCRTSTCSGCAGTHSSNASPARRDSSELGPGTVGLRPKGAPAAIAGYRGTARRSAEAARGRAARPACGFRDHIATDRFPSYWRETLDDLQEAYDPILAQFCLRISSIHLNRKTAGLPWIS